MAENNGRDEKKKDSVFSDVGKQVVDDILLPQMAQSMNNMASSTVYTIGDVIVNLTTNAICRLFKQKPGPVVGKTRNDNRERYSDVSKRKTIDIGARSSGNLEKVTVDSHQKAEAIKQDLIEKLKRYGKIRVADLYEASEGRVTPIVSDYNYGWTNVNDIHYTWDVSGYWFDMPKPIKITDV